MASPGETVTHYRILEKLGEGGMGVVYKAEDVRLHRFVALKFLPENVGDETAKRRFDAEARAASSLDHPNICSIYDVGQSDDGRMFLALAYCEGETLAHRMAKGTTAIGEAVRIGIQIGEGLAEAHSKGIIHRDVKPQNIMVRPDGLVKILDFGVAKLDDDAHITRTDTTVGSPAYMSPEQISGSAASPRSDLWSLGVVLYELISGQRAFGGRGISAVMLAVIQEDPAPLHTLRPEVPTQLSSAVRRAMDKDPQRRFSSAQELVEALRDIGVDTSSPTPAALSARTTTGPSDDDATQVVGVTRDEASIAVLPFNDLSRQKDQDWFCEGLAEELITALSQIQGLRTASRASTAQFRGDVADPATIGAKLRVANLLQGSVRKAGEQLRITTQLIQVDDGSILASDRFDREMKDVFALQEDIALHVVETLRAHFAHSLALPAVKPSTESITAYNLYLKGRHALNLRTPESVRSGIHFFEQALEKDPDYTLAFAGLAIAQMVRGVYAYGPEREALEAAERYCREALARNPGEVEARTTLGSILCFSEWDWQGAEAEFQRAIRDEPANALSHHQYAMYVLAPTGRFAEAFDEYAIALDADPVSLPINVGRGVVLLLARRFDDCIEQLQATLSIDSSFTLAHRLLAEVLLETGDFEGALRHARQGDTDQAEQAASLAATLARAGRRQEALTTLERMRERHEHVSPYLLALVYVGLGDHAEALSHLESAAETRAPALVWAAHRPVFDPLRDEPRFQAILDGMGLLKPVS